jgi:hypothetical protein
MLRGLFSRPREPFSSPPRPILRPGRLKVRWRLSAVPEARIARRCYVVQLALRQVERDVTAAMLT